VEKQPLVSHIEYAGSRRVASRRPRCFLGAVARRRSSPTWFDLDKEIIRQQNTRAKEGRGPYFSWIPRTKVSNSRTNTADGRTVAKVEFNIENL